MKLVITQVLTSNDEIIGIVEELITLPKKSNESTLEYNFNELKVDLGANEIDNALVDSLEFHSISIQTDCVVIYVVDKRSK